MKRRDFFGASTAAVAPLICATGCDRDTVESSKSVLSVTDNGTLAGFTLEELRENYRRILFDEYVPFLYKYAVDDEYGGFMCDLDRDGTYVTTNKRSWYQGRGIWVNSFLYRVDPDPKHVEVARKAIDFILKNKPLEDKWWPAGFTKEGKQYGAFDERIYCDLYLATGLQEFSKVVKDDTYWDMAKEILLKCMPIFDSPDYMPNMIGNEKIGYIKGPRIAGQWMVLLRLVTQMLEFKSDPDVEEVIARCVDAIMNSLQNPEYEIINEYVNHDHSRIDNDLGEVAFGHGPEALWMILLEALRIKDKQLFDLAAERLKRHMEFFWDDVYGGFFTTCTNVNENTWNTRKSLWCQEEPLVGTIIIIEHTGLQWAKDWFARITHYIQDKFSLEQYGFPLYMLYTDRKVTFERHTERFRNFHLPRRLMIGLLSIDRMIKRGGKVLGIE